MGRSQESFHKKEVRKKKEKKKEKDKLQAGDSIDFEVGKNGQKGLFDD